jgi:hypothetical protein
MKRRAELILAGLGLRYPQQATLEVLSALRRCDVVFSNLQGAESTRFLRLFCADVRTISYQGARDEARWSGKIFAELKGGRRAAFVTRGHPLVSGKLADVLMKRARREGVETIHFPALSTMDTILSMAEEVLSATISAAQVYDSRLVIEESVVLQPRVPAVLYLGIRRGPDLARRLKPYAAALAAKLRRLYPAGHKIYLHGPLYDARTFEPLALSAVEERVLREPELVSSLILFLPPVGSLKPRKY